ncbi:hypothetical protein XA68_10785 [Ophiocordyceps unilateralis]|uniref:Uncharacterized protein n=1 Tax=Ophiocordyceps unilateralis TaxID=268505 RepID=A0A2A9PHZ8_OPHUN|nr:hypothetical protein XA68_10785 [Ophiocordyceps unilateralis]
MSYTAASHYAKPCDTTITSTSIRLGFCAALSPFAIEAAAGKQWRLWSQKSDMFLPPSARWTAGHVAESGLWILGPLRKRGTGPYRSVTIWTSSRAVRGQMTRMAISAEERHIVSLPSNDVT